MVFQMLDIIILALIAVFIGYKLYTVLGQRPDIDRQDYENGVHPFDRLKNVFDQKMDLSKPNSLKTVDVEVLSKESDPDKEEGGEIPAHFRVLGEMAQISKIDPERFINEFLAGAEMANAMVRYAVDSGNIDRIYDFVGPSVWAKLQAFDNTQAVNTASKEWVYDQCKSYQQEILSMNIMDAQLKGKKAQIHLNFTYSSIVSKTNFPWEYWILERDLTSKDPNWIIQDIQ